MLRNIRRWVRRALKRDEKEYLLAQMENATREAGVVAERAKEQTKRTTEDATRMRATHADIWRTKDRMDQLVQRMRRG